MTNVAALFTKFPTLERSVDPVYESGFEKASRAHELNR